MRRIAFFIAGMAALVAALPAAAQNKLNTGGLMADKDIVTPADLFELSQVQFGFGTARSAAMAGAFTSLGADLSSMSLNPAGLGMYQRNDISVTPLMSFTHADNSAAKWNNGEASSLNNKNRFTMGNIGFALNVYEGQGALTSLTIGFGYNRLADYNYSQSFCQTGNIGSIADMYSMQLIYGGLKATDIMGNNLNWNRVATELWPAVLGYKCGLTDDPHDNGDWYPSWIGGDRTHKGIDIGQYAGLVSRGSRGEYVLSAGANFDNKFYIGISLGIESLYQRKDFYYGEDYTYPAPGTITEGTAPDLDYQLMWSRLNQTVIVDGTGVNFKIGMIYRPIESLRLGAAFHTPTYYSFDRRYQGAMASQTYINNDTNPDVHPNSGRDIINLSAETPVLLDDGPDTWSFAGPSRLMFGASYTFGRFGVFSVDYERTWYNGIRMKDAPGGINTELLYNDTFRNVFKGANTLRMGLEIRPLPPLALRAGFGYSGSWLQNDNVTLASPIAKQTTYYSAGVGFSLSRNVVLDLAYSYQSSKQTAYYLYFADVLDSLGGIIPGQSNASDDFTTTYDRHTAMLTLGFRF